MQNTRGKILWIDDEIHHLKPHILFLEDKGYTLTQAANGQDGIALSEQNNFDLIYFKKFSIELCILNFKALIPSLNILRGCS